MPVRFISSCMDAVLNEFFPAHQIAYPVVAMRIVGTLLLGALIGFEREAHEKAAGLRTHVLISLSACVFAIVALEAAHLPMLATSSARADPLRVVEAVTSGVAFLAAGMIVFSRGRVRGLTTGAGMWLAGAVGLAIGFGFWMIATMAAICCAIVLGLIRKLEDHDQRRETKRHDKDG